MLRVLGNLVPREVIVVAVSEITLSGISIYLTLSATASFAAPQKISPSPPLLLVLGLLLCYTIIASTLGLYRTAAIAEFHSLIAKGLLAGLLGLLTIAVLPGLHHQSGEIVAGSAHW